MRHTTLVMAAAALVLGMSVGAASASAGEYSPIIANITEAKALATQEVTVGETTLKCDEVKGAGTVLAQTAAVFYPEYSRCEFGHGGYVFNENCDFEFLEPEGVGPVFEGAVNIIEASRKHRCQLDIYGEFLGVGCHVYLKPQGPLRTFYAESPEVGVIDLATEIKGLAFTSEGEGCGIAGVPSGGTNATYIGVIEFIGEGITILP